MIFYFSGTGNSAWVAERMAEALQDRTVAIAEASVQERTYALRADERLGFVFPVYAWGPPKLVQRFVLRLKIDKPSYIYCVCTCGDEAGRAAQLFESTLRKRRWHCDAAFSVVMPEVYICLPGFQLDSQEKEDRKIRNAVARIGFIAEALRRHVRQVRYQCHNGPLPFLKSYLIRPLFYRFLMSPRRFRATDACIACRRCERACPLHNIRVTGKPVWGATCTHCLACYHVCPRHAIHYGNRTLRKGQYNRFLKERFQ